MPKPFLIRLFIFVLLLVVGKVTVSLLSTYTDYFPANLASDFLMLHTREFHGWYRIAFYTHIVASPIGLLLYWPLLCERFRLSYPKVHRGLGKVTIGLILVGVVPSALYMAPFSFAGWPAALGFFGAAIGLSVSVLQGWRLAVRGEFQQHRRWMLRGAVFFHSAITLRILGGLTELLGLPIEETYRLVAWGSWLIPLLLLESYFGEVDRGAHPGLTHRREYKVFGLFGRRASEARKSQPVALARDSAGNHASIPGLTARPSCLRDVPPDA